MPKPESDKTDTAFRSDVDGEQTCRESLEDRFVIHRYRNAPPRRVRFKSGVSNFDLSKAARYPKASRTLHHQIHQLLKPFEYGFMVGLIVLKRVLFTD